LVGEPSIALPFHHLSASHLITIARSGAVRGAGSEVVLACDMRFATRESAIFSQFEPAFGLLPGWRGRPTPRAAHGPRSSARGHFRRDSDIFGDGVRNPPAQLRIQAALKRGLQPTRANSATEAPGCSPVAGGPRRCDCRSCCVAAGDGQRPTATARVSARVVYGRERRGLVGSIPVVTPSTHEGAWREPRTALRQGSELVAGAPGREWDVCRAIAPRMRSGASTLACSP